MTAENPHQRPAPADLSHTPKANIFDRLSTLEGMSVEQLVPDDPRVLNIGETPIIQEKYNSTENQSQTLRAMVAAGEETFGIVGVGTIDASRKDEVKTFILTRFSKVYGERAEIVGVLKPGESMLVGRTSIEDAGFKNVDDTMSRRHFGVALTEDGNQLVINDENATNGTSLLLANSDHSDEVKRVLNDFGIWGPNSVDTRAALEGSNKKRDLLPYELDARTVGDMLGNAAEKGAKLDELISEEPFELELSTGSGKIRLDKPMGSRKFTVIESEDLSMKPGEIVVLDGASISGGAMSPGFIAPNTRISFRKQMGEPIEYVIGDKDEIGMMTQKTYEENARKYPEAYRMEEDGTVKLYIFDPRPRATDFLAHAKRTIITSDGVEAKDLF